MKIDMTSAPEGADVFFQAILFVSRESPCGESFPDVVYCLRGRVAHVFSIETVVPELVHHYFVCREIICLAFI